MDFQGTLLVSSIASDNGTSSVPKLKKQLSKDSVNGMEPSLCYLYVPNVFVQNIVLGDHGV